jgi:hypothetical protein
LSVGNAVLVGVCWWRAYWLDWGSVVGRRKRAWVGLSVAVYVLTASHLVKPIGGFLILLILDVDRLLLNNTSILGDRILHRLQRLLAEWT